MRYKLFDIADVIRSKNSGPYEITFDVIFQDFDTFRKIKDADIFNADMFSKLYKIPVEDVICVIFFEPAKAMKITIKRPICSGDLGEADVYGAQQHMPLLNFEFDC